MPALPLSPQASASANDDNNAKRAVKTKGFEVIYKIDDKPPWYLCLVLGFQHYITMLGAALTFPLVLSPHLCIRDDDPARGFLISTNFFVSGIATFLQSTFGVRLPIVQGSSMTFLIPIFSMLHLPEWQCPTDINGTSITPNDYPDDIWKPRMREVQGAIIGASLLEIAIGFTGVMGFLLTWITPLTIVPTIAVVGLSLTTEAANRCAGHWGIAFFTIFLLALFSQCLLDTGFPYPKYSYKKGWTIAYFPFFKFFPVLLTIMLAWALCAILTITNVLPEGSPARTDIRLSVLSKSPWFRIPYPGQWGVPTFSTAGIVGIFSGIMASIVESVGDYYACARMAEAPTPPKHAINRGIFMEGIGCVTSGLFGTGGAVTSYSENIGAIGITKVASRRVIQYGSLVMMAFGVLGKFGGLFVTIPQPIIGGLFCIMFSMISAVGLSSLHFVDLNSSRNLFVLGFSIFMGMCIPKWIQANPESIYTGNPVFDQIVIVLLSTNMLIGGTIGFILDNLIPGTDEERGILKWRKREDSDAPEFGPSKSYDIPFITPILRKITFFRYLPISPTYEEGIISKKVSALKDYIKRRRMPSPA